MDAQWAMEQLREYLRLTERVPLQPGDSAPKGAKTRNRGGAEEIELLTYRVNLVAIAVFDTPDRPRGIDRNFAKQLLWELSEGAAVRVRLGLDEHGPMLDADDFHPWVWRAARPFWESGSRETAIWAALANINVRMQKKAGRADASEHGLAADLFSTDPPKDGRPRLRLCDATNEKTFQSVHQGAAHLARALYMGVRNPIAHHGPTEFAMPEQEALEALSACSLFARWVDRAEVVTVAEGAGKGPKE